MPTLILIGLTLSGLIVLVAACMNPNPPQQLIEPGDLSDETPCAWCARENGDLNSEDSHGVCPRHAGELLEQKRRISQSA